MKKLAILILSIMIVSVASAQNGNLHGMDSLFDAHLQAMEARFDNHLRQMDSTFFDYLEQHWEQFSILPEEQEETYQESRPFSEEEYSPIQYVDSRPKKKPQYASYVISFYGEKINFQVDKASLFSIAGTGEKEIAKACRRLADTDISAILSTTKAGQQRMKLNDWGRFLIFEKLAARVYPANRNQEQTLFLYYLLLRSGFDVKLARTDRLVLLVPFSSRVFLQKRVKIGEQYYCIYGETGDSNKQLFSYKENHALAKRKVDLYLQDPPAFPPASVQQKTLSWNKNLVSFYDSYPHTELSIYFHAGISKELQSEVIRKFGKATTPSGKLQKVNEVLNFFHQQMPYATDMEKLGYEWKFFPEQSLSHPFTDCEDRAILFTHIVKTLTDLDVVLLVYPEHVCTGVYFEKNGYSVCDPSYHGAKAGDKMKGLNDSELKIIPLSGPSRNRL